jgi:hypothetical protein
VRRQFALLLVLLASGCDTKPVPPVPSSKPAPPASSSDADAPQFAYCPRAKFANCTVAKCELTTNGNFACWCFEDDRYSATAWKGSQSASCVAATPTTLQSRFHPITAYQECGAAAQVQEWAWCLGVSCTPMKNPQNPNSTANVRCDCTPIPKGVSHVPYIVTTSSYAADNCKVQYWSSATPNDVSQITAFLQKQVPDLVPPVVLSPPDSGRAQ